MQVKRYMLGKGSWATPYYIATGGQKGPCVMVVAGIHGKEIASIRAAEKLVKLLNQQKLRFSQGKLIIVPIVNQEAYRKRIRGIPDLNRTFPRKKKQLATQPLSADLFKLTQKHQPEWYLDLHEANGLSQKDAKVLGQTLITNKANLVVPTVRRIIKRMNRSIQVSDRHFNIRLHELPGSSRTAAARILGARAVTVETGWSLPKKVRIHYQLEIVQHFLKEAGIVKGNEVYLSAKVRTVTSRKYCITK
ncbi:succinylglutamate desuccinylase/aspartoacylase family protein [Paenibacillus sp. EKM212P]|uniref:succinylglutamate desuccinylase/aspartoacylase domain-containing protein n=1 Tax=Paenibacillus sp. EKM212P TaxID=1683680 RepID=UPI0013EE0CAB|nr:succinylglutamate desuccinylase/aspartoacylase family protein [Paenibacillus sp. EKM212P]KAF6574743.1 succinylglutamate desuccinylase/aspartoacylase family protein [Paenibacillus sp. EKM212P]